MRGARMVASVCWMTSSRASCTWPRKLRVTCILAAGVQRIFASEAGMSLRADFASSSATGAGRPMPMKRRIGLRLVNDAVYPDLGAPEAVEYVSVWHKGGQIQSPPAMQADTARYACKGRSLMLSVWPEFRQLRCEFRIQQRTLVFFHARHSFTSGRGAAMPGQRMISRARADSLKYRPNCNDEYIESRSRHTRSSAA